jgi:hypothetical protein
MPPGPSGIRLLDRHAVRRPSERPLPPVRCRGDLDARTIGGHDHDHGVAPHPPHLVVRSGLPYLIGRPVGFDQLVPEQERRCRPDQHIAYPAAETALPLPPKPGYLAVSDADRSLESAGLAADPGPPGKQNTDQDDDHYQVDSQYRQERDKHDLILQTPGCDLIIPGGLFPLIRRQCSRGINP